MKNLTIIRRITFNVTLKNYVVAILRHLLRLNGITIYYTLFFLVILKERLKIYIFYEFYLSSHSCLKNQ
jgi:hypothetical protein